MGTCIILSSETEQMTQASVGFQEKSEIFEVCPPWMNSSSGGPGGQTSEYALVVDIQKTVNIQCCQLADSDLNIGG